MKKARGPFSSQLDPFAPRQLHVNMRNDFSSMRIFADRTTIPSCLYYTGSNIVVKIVLAV